MLLSYMRLQVSALKPPLLLGVCNLTELKERVSAYIQNVEQFLETAEKEDLPEPAKRILNIAKSYLSDSKYYFEKGDYTTSLSCIAYAEGLLDALRYLGFIEQAEWKPLSQLLKRPKVLLAGSFEFIHPGHLALIKYAWSLGEVYVVLSRDVNFEKFKGRKPVLSERDRLDVVSSIKYVSRALLGDPVDFLKPVEEIKPDVILLGPDQWISQEELEKRLEERGFKNIRVVRFPERLGQWSSTSIYNSLVSSR